MLNIFSFFFSVSRRAAYPVRNRQPGDRSSDPAPDLHVAAVHAEHAGQLHQAPAHHPRGLHIRGDRRLGVTGQCH